MAPTDDAPRRRHSVARWASAHEGPELRARAQCLLPDGHRPPADARPPRLAARGQRLALRAQVVQRPLRVACVTQVHSLPEAGNDGILMQALDRVARLLRFSPAKRLNTKDAYALW